MGGNEDRPPSSTSSQLSKPKPPPRGPPRPTITLPPRPFADTIFNSGPGVGSGFGLGFSPGPMTLVSSFFSDSDEFKSFSQLLAGAMASPAAVQQRPVLPPPPPNERSSGVADVSSSGVGGGGTSRTSGTSGVDLQFRHNRPPGLVIAQPPPMFTVPPGLSPATLLDSPGFGLFSPGPYGMTHQQALAQVTAQAAQSNSHAQVQAEYSSLAPAAAFGQLPSFTVDTAADQQIPPSIPDSRATKESPDLCLSEQRFQQSSHNVDKPADDGYNWRKYGQKQVKGSEFPRSYYKCTHPNCPVKKKVERSLAGHVTEIIYKGQHNHQPPKLNKRAKDTGNSNGNSLNQVNAELPSQFQSGNSNKSKEGASAYSMPKRNQETSQATAEHLSASSDSEEVAGAEAGVDEKDEDESDTKRRCTEVTYSESASSHRTVTEPRIIVQTTSEVDLLDDGYRWRKYGQKVVKGNPYPRSYYKCTTPGCNVRKHVERASTDPKAVVTTYEGRHNHEVPTARNSSHNTANSNASQLRPPNVVTETRALSNNNQQPIARLLLKEEQVT